MNRWKKGYFYKIEEFFSIAKSSRSAQRVENTLLKQNQSFSYYLLQIFEVDLESSSCKTVVPWFTMLYFFTIDITYDFFKWKVCQIPESKKCIVVIWQKIAYRISANSFRGNYSFLNLVLCTVTFGDST